MQTADRGVRVPGALSAVFGKHLVQAVGVLGEIVEPDGAVLDERHRFAVAFHRHHDVEPGLAHLPHRALECRVGDGDHAIGEAKRAHQFLERLQAACLLTELVTGKLHEQQRIRLATHETLHGRAEGGDVARQIDHGAVDQLHGRGLEFNDVAGGVHRLVEGREVADPEHLVGRERLQHQLDGGEKRQRALRADQQVGHVVTAGGDAVDVVTPHPAQELGPARRDLAGLARGDAAQPLDEPAVIRVAVHLREIGRHLGEVPAFAIRHDRIDGTHVVDRVAVADGTRAAAVVAGHAAEGGATRGGRINRKEQPMRPELGIQLVEHDARLHAHATRLDVQMQDPVQMLAHVDHHAVAHGLAAL